MEAFLLNLLYVVVIAAVPVIVAYGAKLFKAKREEILSKIDNTYVKNTITEATDIIVNAVDFVSQTYVDSLKKAGEFTVEEQKVALEKAMEQAKGLLSSGAVELITEKYNDLDEWIKSIIESYIKTTKTQK